jgi:hypothetical protein
MLKEQSKPNALELAHPLPHPAEAECSPRNGKQPNNGDHAGDGLIPATQNLAKTRQDLQSQPQHD